MLTREMSPFGMGVWSSEGEVEESVRVGDEGGDGDGDGVGETRSRAAERMRT